MHESAATPAFYSARPRLFVDGTEEISLAEGVDTLLIEETSEGLYRCEITVGNWGSAGSDVDYLYFDRRTVDLGKELSVRIGDGEAGGQVFLGIITGMEGRYPQNRPPEIALLAEDRLQDLRMTRRSRSFEDVSDADVIRQIAGEHDLQAEVDLSGPTYRTLAQVNQSDLAFLRERVRSVGAELWIEDDTLLAMARDQRQSTGLSLTYHQRLREFSVLADLAHQCTELRVTGWDVATKQAIRESAGEADLGSELGRDERAGGDWLRETRGERVQQLVHLQPANDAEARSLAEAHYLRSARRFVRGSGLAEGDVRLRVGAGLTLNGIGPMFEGDYYVSEVRHTFDTEHGFQTRFRVERAGIPS